MKLPERTTLTPVNVASGETSNLSVDARVAAAHALREPRSRRRHRRRRQSRHEAGDRRDARARSRRQCRSSRSRPTSAPGGSSSVTFSAVHRRVAQHARHGAPAGRRLDARQRVPLRRVAVRARARRWSINRSGAEREALYLSRALAISESPRVELTTRTPTTVIGRRSAPGVRRPRERRPGARRSRGPADALRRRGRRAVHRGRAAMRRGRRSAADTVPGLPGDPVDRTMTTPSRLGGLEYSHPGVRAVPRAAHRRLLRGPLLRLPRRPEAHRPGAGAVRRRHAGADGEQGADRRARPRAAVDLHAGPGMERFGRSNRCSCRSSTR